MPKEQPSEKNTSHENKSHKKTNKKASGEGPPIKVIILWVVIMGLIVSIYFLTDSKNAKAEEWSINQVLEEIERDNIKEGYIENIPNSGGSYSEIHFLLKASADANDENIERMARGRITETTLETLQASGLFKELPPKNSIFTEALVTIITFAAIIGILYLLFVRQLRSAGRGAFSFGKSRAKMLAEDKEKVTFKDVAGCDEAKEEVSEVVDFLKDPEKFEKIGGRIPKGVLLVGPPGTGKTLLARAVAGEADVPFFSISGSDFVEMFVGVGAARVRDMFEQGHRQAPCIIFIDEIDAVGRQRGAGLGGGNDEREQTLNSLLVEMDGFDPQEGIIIIAATNRPDVLDNALLRPGRFDRQVHVDLPDVNGRRDILDVHAQKIKVAEAVDMETVARSTSGFAGADLANLLNEAALLAARHNKPEVLMEHINEARDKIAYGRERRKLMDDEDKSIIAYHEAGHAIVQAIIDDGKLPIHKVTIIPRGQSLGSTMFIPKKDILNQSKTFLTNRICCAMGGRVAEAIVFNEITSGAAGDIKQSTELARHMVCDWGMSDLGMIGYGNNQEHLFLGREITRHHQHSEVTSQLIDQAVKAIIDEQYQRAQTILTEHRPALETLAKSLLEYETLEGKHVHEIIDHGEITSSVETYSHKQNHEHLAEESTESEAASLEQEPKESDQPLQSLFFDNQAFRRES